MPQTLRISLSVSRVNAKGFYSQTDPSAWEEHQKKILKRKEVQSCTQHYRCVTYHYTSNLYNRHNSKGKSNKPLEKLTCQCFQVVLAERCHLLTDTLNSAIQESFQATYGDINSNQGLPEVFTFMPQILKRTKESMQQKTRVYLTNTTQRQASPHCSIALRKV